MGGERYWVLGILFLASLFSLGSGYDDSDYDYQVAPKPWTYQTQLVIDPTTELDASENDRVVTELGDRSFDHAKNLAVWVYEKIDAQKENVFFVGSMVFGYIWNKSSGLVLFLMNGALNQSAFMTSSEAVNKISEVLNQIETIGSPSSLQNKLPRMKREAQLTAVSAATSIAASGAGLIFHFMNGKNSVWTPDQRTSAALVVAFLSNIVGSSAAGYLSDELADLNLIDLSDFSQAVQAPMKSLIQLKDQLVEYSIPTSILSGVGIYVQLACYLYRPATMRASTAKRPRK